MKIDLWQDLAGQGLLTGVNGSGKRVREALTAETRRELLDSLERLEQGGVEFRYDRRIGPDQALTAAEALSRLEKGRPGKPFRLEATTPDGGEVRVHCLTDVESLEYRHGAGAEALSDRHRAVARSVEGLEAAGFQLVSEYEDLARHGEDFGFGESARRGDDWYRVESAEELVALDYLLGDGQDHGLRDAPTAHGVRDLYSRGLSLRDWHGKQSDAFEAWQTAQAGHPAWVTHERGWGPYVKGPGWEIALQDVPALERATAEAERVGDTRLGRLYEPTPNRTFAERYAMQTIHPLGDWSMDEAARAYAEVNEALQVWDTPYLEPTARELYEVLADRCQSGPELTRAAEALGRGIREQGYGGVEQAERFVAEMAVRPREEVARLVEGLDSEAGGVHVGRREVRIGEVTLPIG